MVEIMDSQKQEEVYLSLLRQWKYELSSPKITKIPNKDLFLRDIRALIANIQQDLANSKNKVITLVHEKTLRNIHYMVNDLLELRTDKILQSSRIHAKIDDEFLLSIETEYYRSLYVAFKGYSKTKKMFVEEIENGKDSNIGDHNYCETSPEITSITHQFNDNFANPSKKLSSSQNLSPEDHNSDMVIDNSLYDVNPSTNNSDFSNSTPNSTSDSNSTLLMSVSHDPSQNIHNEIINSSSVSLPSEIQNDRQEISKNSSTSLPSTKNTNASKSSLMNKMESPGKCKPVSYISIRTLDSISALVGEDFKIYGPFNKDDMIRLPVRNAEILIEEKVATILQY